jgi:HK97 gp10 family phage protein
MPTFKNAADLKKHMEKILTIQAQVKAFGTIGRATVLVQNTAKESLGKKGSGRVYQKYNQRRVHQASIAGAPPATDTGFLRSNITMNVKKRSNGSMVGQIVSAAPYSQALEFGTTTMMPRPFMSPALEKNRRKIVKMFKDDGIV